MIGIKAALAYLTKTDDSARSRGEEAILREVAHLEDEDLIEKIVATDLDGIFGIMG